MTGEEVERWRADRPDRFATLLRRMARWAMDHHDGLAAADPAVPALLHDRAADNWRPLLAIADAAGGKWLSRAREAASALSGVDETDSLQTMLLEDVRAIFAAKGADEIGSSSIVAELGKLEHRPWPEISGGKPITPHRLAKLLKRFGIGPAHTEKGNVYGKDAFSDAWTRYLRDESFRPSGTQQTSGFEAAGEPSGALGAPPTPEGSETAPNPRRSSLPEALNLPRPETDEMAMEEIVI
jgi:hypothetical protein